MAITGGCLCGAVRYTVDAERHRVAAARGIAYLSKPVKPSVLLAKIRQCLDKT